MRILQIIVGTTCLIIMFSYTMSNEQLNSDESSEESDEKDDSDESDEESDESDEVEELNGNNSCHGICTELKKCKETLKGLSIHFDTEKLKISRKFCKLKKAKNVCCPTLNGAPSGHTNSNLEDYRFAVNNSCGFVHVKRSFPKVVGGRNSEVGAWPWLAVFAYDLVLDIKFMCSGALISNRHVLTAAHCILFNLIFVRLGEFDLRSDEETHHLDVNYTKVIKSNFDFKSGRNDLAILILAEVVQFTDFISPICLPINRKKSYVGLKPFVAGWGDTQEQGKPAKILQELQVTVIDNQVCQENFKAAGELQSDYQFDETVICAGDLEGGKDTCQGDSGGPLMMPELIDGSLRYSIIGVVSRGIGCARKNMGGAYTSIPYHIDWIKENLQEDSQNIKPI